MSNPSPCQARARSGNQRHLRAFTEPLGRTPKARSITGLFLGIETHDGVAQRLTLDPGAHAAASPGSRPQGELAMASIVAPPRQRGSFLASSGSSVRGGISSRVPDLAPSRRLLT